MPKHLQLWFSTVLLSSWPSTGNAHLLRIHQRERENPSNASQPPALSKGELAGVVVGVMAIVVAIGLPIWQYNLSMRTRSQQPSPVASDMPAQPAASSPAASSPAAVNIMNNSFTFNILHGSTMPHAGGRRLGGGPPRSATFPGTGVAMEGGALLLPEQAHVRDR